MAYRAEIEIALKGVRALQGFRKELQSTANEVDRVNAALNKFAKSNPFTASGGRRLLTTGASSPLFGGQSSQVEGRVKRLLAIKKDELTLEKALLGLQEKSRGLDAASVAENNRLLDLKAQEVARNNEIIRQERVKQSILRKRQRLEAAGRGPGGRGARRRGRQRFTDIATGAGFPLLFGGGPLQALAGGIGGAAGGLGGAIAGSAIVAQLEGFARAAAETGVALTSTGGALELVREKSLFSKESNRELAAQLEEQGDAAGLAKLLTEELSLAIGNNGVEALQDLGNTTKETTRLWNLLTTQLFKLIAGPLNDFLKIVNNVLGGITTRGRFEGLSQDLAGNEAFQTAVREKRKARGRNARLGSLQTEDQLDLLKRAEAGEFGALPRTAVIPVTAEDERTITPGGTKAGRRSRIPDLNAEIGLQERLLTLNNQIAQAKRDENPVREAALQMEVALEQQAARRAIIDAKRIPEAEKILEKQLLELQTDQKILEIQNRLRDIRAAKAEEVANTITDLESEGALLRGKLAGNETEVELKQKIAEATKDMSATDAKRVEDLIRGNALLKEQIAIADDMKRVYEQIGMSIKTGVVDAITAAVDGTKSLAEVASNTLRKIADQLLNIGVNFALFGAPSGTGTGGGLLGGLFANGGRPPVGKPSIVGERGPELFVPRSSGTIVPNGAFGGSANVTVNVDASGSSVQGDGPSANQLGKAIGAAVQAELIKQKRPGGLLTR